MTRELMLIAVLGCLAFSAGCGEGWGPATQDATNTRGTVSAIMGPKGPAIDGTLDSPLWQHCPALTLGEVQSDQVGQLKTTARVLLDKTHLYVAWDALEADTDSIVAGETQRDGSIWNDDCVELFVCADPRVGSCHFIINSKGVILDSISRPGEDEDTSWDSSAVVKTSVQKNKRWVVTMSVPLKELGAYAGESQTWPMNLNRSKPQDDGGWIESSWSAKGLSKYTNPTGWGKIINVRVVRSPGGVTRTAPPL